ncbi:MAG: DUF349 domain-containing protein [Cytophagales bacterium]|nr:DUF349 domain-containing protein [Cytophagales bacterium]MDW8384103.1 DUF349 domain-containing protein [Flammeovirgaceae bacterium]
MATVKEYPHITPYGYVADGKVYLKGYGEYPDREIGVVRESDEKSLQYFVDRFSMMRQKIEDVAKAVETAENKGSYLMKLIHMREQLATYNGLGNFPELYERIQELEAKINAYISANRLKNEAIKRALVAEAEALKSSMDWKETASKLKELKMKWIKTGSAPKEVEEQLSTAFHEALNVFYERRKQFIHAQAVQIKEKVEKYNKLLNEIRKINKQGGGVSFLQQVKQLQAQWKEVGSVPKKRLGKLPSMFKKEIDQYFKNLKSSNAKKSPIQLKREMLEMTDNILNLGSPYNIGKVKQMQEKWKQLGQLPHPEDKELNLKFRIACNEIFESHFLDRTAYNLFDQFYKKPLKEQTAIKVELLEKSLKQDSQELSEFNAKYGAQIDADPTNPANRQLIQERNNYINKLKTKQRILKKLKDSLLHLCLLFVLSELMLFF